LKASLLRALGKVKHVADEKVRDRLTGRMEKLQAKLSQVTPRRGPALMAFSDASRLVTRLVSNRETVLAALSELDVPKPRL